MTRTHGFLWLKGNGSVKREEGSTRFVDRNGECGVRVHRAKRRTAWQPVYREERQRQKRSCLPDEINRARNGEGPVDGREFAPRAHNIINKGRGNVTDTVGNQKIYITQCG